MQGLFVFKMEMKLGKNQNQKSIKTRMISGLRKEGDISRLSYPMKGMI